MSNRNENRPEYKKTKVGWIPEEWECCKLSTLGNFTNGINKDKSEFGKGTPLVNLQDVFGRNVITDLPTGLVTCSDEERNRYCLRSGDVLFVRSSVKPEGVGLTTVVLHNLHDCVYSGFLIRYRPKKNIFDTSFLKYIFYGPLFRKTILRYSTISANTNINQVALSSIWLALPPLPEQKKIAEILSAWDRAIEQVGKLIDAKERLKKGLMQQLLTGRMRFSEFGKPVREKGELPEGWLKKHFSTIFKRVNLKRFQISKKDYKESGKYPVVDQGQEKIVAWSNAEPITDPLPVIIFGDHTREIKWIDFPFIPGADGTIILISADETSTVFAYFLLCNTKIVSLGYSRHFSELKSKKFLVPQIPEQIRIAAVLSSCDREIELLKKKQEKLKEQKKGLMQKLLTGEVRVKVKEMDT